MNFNNLSPEHKKLIFELHKRIEIMESRLLRLQNQAVKIEGPLMQQVAKEMYICLN